MTSQSPTSRTLKELGELGWMCQVVERWCPHSKRRIDLFGVIDLVALGPNICLGVQCCAMSGHAAHLNKIRTSEGSRKWLEAGNELQIWSWRKLLKKRGGKAFKWEVDIDPIYEEDLLT